LDQFDRHSVSIYLISSTTGGQRISHLKLTYMYVYPLVTQTCRQLISDDVCYG